MKIHHSLKKPKSNKNKTAASNKKSYCSLGSDDVKDNSNIINLSLEEEDNITEKVNVSKFFTQSISYNIKNKILKILDTVSNLNEAYEFLEPVDYEGLNMPSYPKIIKYPSDLQTVKENLKNNRYITVQQCLNAIQLIWDNCRTFNPPSNPIIIVCDICERKFKKEFEKSFQVNLELNEKYSSKNLGVNEKIELLEDLNYLKENGFQVNC